MNRKLRLKVLIDSDAFVGSFFDADAHHERASQIFERLAETDTEMFTTSAVIAETVTLMSRRYGQETTLKFLTTIESTFIPIIHINEVLHADALSLFKQQTKKGTSYVDCANVVVCRYFGIKKIFSFDKEYTKAFDISLITVQ